MIDSYLREAKGVRRRARSSASYRPTRGMSIPGPVAAYSYRRLDPAVQAGRGAGAVAPGPVQRRRLLPEGIFETPLGDVAIDG